ncbi:MAG: L,D-transpeptidase family protein [Solirubrobacteraceae bacterium]
MRAARLLCSSLLVLGLAGAPAAHAADERIIPEGISAGGVDLSLLTVDEATAALGDDMGLQTALRQDIVLGAAGIPWTLTMSKARLRFDARETAERAALTETPAAPVTVRLAVTWSKAAVRAWVASVAKGTWRAPRPAKLRMTLRHMLVTESRGGFRLNKRSVTRKVTRALTGLGERRLHQRMLKVRPRRTTRDLRNAYPTVITVDREGFRLRLFKRLRISKRYGIAVGMAGLDTPAGTYRIQNKQVDPTWTKPDSDWVPAGERGDVVPGGDPSNPLKARWMGIYDGVGIHGTSEDWSIGSRASHGCIRMHVSDVIDLYDRVPVGTPVLIG